jgi:hypothetical protein
VGVVVWVLLYRVPAGGGTPPRFLALLGLWGPHGRFAQAEQVGDLAHTQLRPGDGIENPDARCVAEHAEGLGERLNGGGLEQNI